MKKLASISVQNVNFNYNSEKEIFKDISFKISPREKVAIMWANWIWKTSLLNLIIERENKEFDWKISIPKWVKIGYWEQIILENKMWFTLFEYFLDEKWLLNILSDYLNLTELFEKSLDFSSINFEEKNKSLKVENKTIQDLITNFTNWNQKQIIQPLFLSEENAFEILEEIENKDKNFLYFPENKLNNIFLKEAENFLYKSKDWEKGISTKIFLEHFKTYFDYLIEKTKFQNYFYENFYKEWLELLWELQEKYEKAWAYELERKIEESLEIVNLNIDYKNTKLSTLSGGQKNKLILAKTIFSDPDILMLDEPTNNLDKKAYENLVEYVKKFNWTIVCISHDPDFLATFVKKVLYIDWFQKNIREYYWNYSDVEREVEEQIERDRSKMNRIDKEIKFKETVLHKRAQQAKIYWSAKLAQNVKQLKNKIEKLKDWKWESLKEDKIISRFTIPCSVPDDDLVQFFSVDYFEDWEEKNWNLDLSILKGSICLLYWKNWKWKTTFLRKFAQKKADVWMHADVEIWYYSQNFEELNMEWTVQEAMEDINWFDYQGLRWVLARFLFSKEEQMEIKVKELSEWQKALLAIARLVFKKPNLLVLDEPTNHINFKHIPVIIESLKNYRWTILLVSHDTAFLKEMPISKVIDLDQKKVIKWELFKKTL